MLKASICSIGDEILIGQIINTNAAFISQNLEKNGVKVCKIISVGDNSNDIFNVLDKELQENDIVVTTGGLGPTKDDITKDVLMRLSGAKAYTTNEKQLEIIHNIFISKKLEILESNINQAQVPNTCYVINNKLGTAPIMAFKLSKKLYPNEPVLYALPGVPFECEGAIKDIIEDINSKYNKLSNISHKSIMIYGFPESELSKLIEDWENALPPCLRIAYLPSTLVGIKLRFSIYDKSKEEADLIINQEISKLETIIGKEHIYSYSEENLEEVIGKILKEKRKTLSVAESCTGGEISHLITTVSGSSEYYLGSVTSYAIPIKEKVLGVDSDIIKKYGVVSSEVACAMAEGVRILTGSDFSVATTGLAGSEPDERNPAGTVWIGVSSKEKNESIKLIFHNDRKRNIERFAASALFFLLNFIKNS